MPTAHPYIANYLANGRACGPRQRAGVAVENTQRRHLRCGLSRTLRKLNDEVFLLPGVDRPYMKSLWTPSTRWIGVTEEGLEGGPVIPDDYDGSAASLEQLRANVERSGKSASWSPATTARASSSCRCSTRTRRQAPRLPRVFERARAAARQVRPDAIQVHITGFAKVVGDLIDGLQQVLLFFALAIAICTAVLYWYTRCVRSTLLVVACSLVAVVWQLGLLPTLGYELDPYSILVPFLVFAIGMSHGAQKMNGIMQDIGRGTHSWSPRATRSAACSSPASPRCSPTRSASRC